MSDEIAIFNQIRCIEQDGWRLTLAGDSLGDWFELSNKSKGVKGVPVSALIHAAHFIEGYNLCAKAKSREAGE